MSRYVPVSVVTTSANSASAIATGSIKSTVVVRVYTSLGLLDVYSLNQVNATAAATDVQQQYNAAAAAQTPQNTRRVSFSNVARDKIVRIAM